MTSNVSSDLIGGRYRIDSELGRGGMARVYRVLDERSGERLALKALFAHGEQSATLRAMFEREYHTLVQLAHPNIVRVFDYGLDGDDPYYTMELLTGSDARVATQSGPLGIHQICALLRDCAAALGLVHSRRMVHRDVSPRNVWCTPELRGKLIDFGTLVAAGTQTRIAGTPPFVAPEALYAQPLDARCDLYALGALAYYLLTRQNAYPARVLADLPELWRHSPPRPHALRAEIPRALSDLVMGMLSLDARARPATAAEIYERLSVLADLPIDDQGLTAQAFLTSPTLVGRADASGALSKALRRAMDRRGGTLCISAPSGYGRTRMLGSVVLEARLAGAIVVSVDASTVASGPLRVAVSAAERLLDEMPMLAALAMELGPVLGNASAVLHRAFGSPDLAELTALQRGPELSAAIAKLFERAVQQRALVLAVDDVHHSDPHSLAVLGRLSLTATDRALLVLTTCDTSALKQPPPALAQLVQPGRRVELPPLTAEHTHDLLESVFGAVPGLGETASWIHELAAGSPQACMQCAQYLVDQRVARYERGKWKLPGQLREEDVPPTLSQMLARRVAALGHDAFALALGIALARDESRSAWQPATHVRMQDFPRLLEGADAARASAALDELLRAGIVQQRDDGYVLAQRALVDVLIQAAPQAALSTSHRRLADIFMQPGYRATWVAIRQLLAAGEYARAREAIVSYARSSNLATADWGALRVSLQVLCANEALAHWQAEAGPVAEGVLLRRTVLTAAAVYDWRFALRHGDAQLSQLRADCGLVYLDAVDSTLPLAQRVLECLKRAQHAYDAASERERGMPPGEAIRELAGAAMQLSRAYVCAHETARARGLLPNMEALAAVIPQLALVVDTCKLAIDRVSGREYGDGLVALADRILEATTIPDLLRQGASALYVHEQCLDDARIGRVRALDQIGRIANAGAFDDLFLVLHGRWLSYAFLGQTEQAHALRRRSEVITEDDVWRYKAYVYVEAEYYALIGDLQGLNHVVDTMAELADMFPGWRPWLAYARAAIHRVRGELPAARTELERGLLEAPAGEHRAWLHAAPAHAEILLFLGDAAAAERAARDIILRVEQLGLGRTCAVSAYRVLSRALSEQRQPDSGRQAVQRALELARELQYGGLPLAQLYLAQAEVELAAGNAAACISILRDIHLSIEHSHAPAFIHAYQELRAESSRQVADAAPDVSPTDDGAVDPATMYAEAETLLVTADGSRQRSVRALQLLLQDSGADAGHLLLVDATGLYPAASIALPPPNEQLMLAVSTYFDSRLSAATTVTHSVTAAHGDGVLADGGRTLLPVLLTCPDVARVSVAGIALIDARGELRMPRTELVRVISQCLFAAGDAVALAL